MPAKYDALIIGTGQAGPALAHRLAAAGWTTAVVERHKFGGTCVNTGCIPTKTLVASARAAYVARRAADYGVTFGGEVSLDMARVKARKDAISSKSSQGLERSLKTLEHATVYEGHACFTGPHTVAVGDQTLEAERIFINVGARAFVPDMPLGDVPYLTNSSMMEVDFLPEHLIVIGGSYVGLEFGQMYRRFGSKVTIVEQGPRLISRDDEDVSAAVKEILEAEDIEIRLDAKCLSEHRGTARSPSPWSARQAHPRPSDRISCWPSNGGRTPTTSASISLVSKPTHAVTSPWTTSCAPTRTASGRWATAMAREPSRTRRTTTSRSLRRTCWTTTRGASATGF